MRKNIFKLPTEFLDIEDTSKLLRQFFLEIININCTV